MNDISLGQEIKRGALRFYLAPGMNLYLRIALFVILVTTGASMMFRVHWAAGAPVFILGLVMISAHDVQNSRKSPDTDKDRWVVGSSKDLRKIERKVEQAKLLPSNAMSGVDGWGCLSVLGALAGFAALDFIFLPEDLYYNYLFTIIFLQLGLLFGLFFTTNASQWEPKTIIGKKDHFVRQRDRILERWKDLKPVVRPMLLLDEGDKDLVTPEDIKLLVTFEEAPEDFIGIQAQITYNMSQPYLYCVVLCKKTFSPMFNYQPKAASKITFQKGEDKDVRYLVVRQTTTRDSGYHTSSDEEDHVVDTAMGVALDLITR